MKAQMKDNLLERYRKHFEKEHNDPFYIVDQDIIEFLESIDSKEVELVFSGGDAFEFKDNNIWLPNTLWDEI